MWSMKYENVRMWSMRVWNMKCKYESMKCELWSM
jgi:hypothetical protein